MSIDIHKAISKHAAHQLPHHVLLSLLTDYKRPNDKINELVKEKALTSVKKGLYIAGPLISAGKPEPFLLANYLYGPSYISLETALSFHGLIPERVYEIASMTTKAPNQFSTPIGIFSYTKLPLPYFAFGIQSVHISGKSRALMASPEKALCDKIISTAGVLFRSSAQALSYLRDDLRIDDGKLQTLSVNQIKKWVKDAPKSASIKILAEGLYQLQYD